MPWQNCKIVGAGADPTLYHGQPIEDRGKPTFRMSSSSLREFACCPSRWRKGYETPETPAKRFGSILDCRYLTPEQFEKRYAVVPPGAPKKPTSAQRKSVLGPKAKPDTVYAVDWWDNFLEEHAGATIITQKELDEVDTAISRLSENEVIRRWHESCDHQVWITGEWLDEETGIVVPCQCLIDDVPRRGTEFDSCAGDLKTSKNAASEPFKRWAFKVGYHIQAAIDLDMLVAAEGSDRNTWCFTIVENFPPWEPNRAMYGQSGDMGSPGFVEIGREARHGGYQKFLANYAKCLATGKWPGYNDIDEAIQGWCVLRPDPFMAEKASFGPQYDFDAEEDDEEPVPGIDEDSNENEVVP